MEQINNEELREVKWPILKEILPEGKGLISLGCIKDKKLCFMLDLGTSVYHVIIDGRLTTLIKLPGSSEFAMQEHIKLLHKFQEEN